MTPAPTQLSPAAPPAGKSSPPNCSESRARILVVDDDPLVSESVAAILNAAGYEVFRATTVAEAVRSVTCQSPDVAVVDVELNGNQHAGFELLKQIKVHNPSIAVIIITGASSKQRVVAALRGGANDYLEKPFRGDELVKRVEAAVLQRNRLWAY